MRFAALVGVVALGATACAFSAGCFGDARRSDGGSGGSGGGQSPAPPPPTATTPSPSPSGDDGGVAVKPILVDVDPNRTLTAMPGDGVGIFAEYLPGGHWHLWWTCDTNKSTQSCPFDIRTTVGVGAITNAVADPTAKEVTLTTPSASEVIADSTTTTQTDGITFDTAPGAVITVDAYIGNLHDGSYFFFVQNGIVNGGFKGTLSDPLQLEGSSP